MRNYLHKVEGAPSRHRTKGGEGLAPSNIGKAGSKGTQAIDVRLGGEDVKKSY